MRESFERRHEAEHHLGREVRAGALIERLAGLPDDVTEEAFLSDLEPLPYAGLLDAAACDYGVIGSRAPLSGAQKWRAEALRVMRLQSRTIAV
jgi:hypothetical protein